MKIPNDDDFATTVAYFFQGSKAALTSYYLENIYCVI